MKEKEPAFVYEILEDSNISHISILIPLSDNIKGALQTYDSVSKQHDIDVRIILVVNGQNSEQIARILRGKVDGYTKVITCMKRGKACALNTALNYVETEWLGVIDSDCELRDACSLKRLCDSVTDKTIAAGGRLIVRRKWKPIMWIQRYCRRKHRKYHIAYEPRAVCLTNVPDSLHRLFCQRDRWQRGLIGSLFRNITFGLTKVF